MAKRGPAPKKPSQRQRRNKPTSAPVLKAAPPAASDRPAAKKDWLVATRKRWDDYWASKLARLVDPVLDLQALERLFDLHDERERAMRAFRKKRLVTGSKGQLVLNPLGRMMKEYDAEIRQLEDRFGMSPSARQRLQADLGDDSGSLEELNRQLMGDDDARDPRLTVIEGGGAAAT